MNAALGPDANLSEADAPAVSGLSQPPEPPAQRTSSGLYHHLDPASPTAPCQWSSLLPISSSTVDQNLDVDVSFNNNLGHDASEQQFEEAPLNIPHTEPIQSNFDATGIQGNNSELNILSNNVSMSNVSIHGVPGVWSYNYQMGPSTYRTAMSNVSSVGKVFHISNSAFSDHINILHRCVQSKSRLLNCSDSQTRNLPKVHLSVSLMLSLFNSIYRPLAMSWYTPTKFYYHITSLTMWQLNPTRELYMQLPMRYRPSALQLSESYPPIIDWCPFPSIRDRLIMLHAANSNIDQIICDIATAYVIETDISTIIQLDRPTFGYIRVWDLIQAMDEPTDCLSSNAPESLATTNLAAYQAEISSIEQETDFQEVSLPAPSMEALFQTDKYARLAFKELRMDDGVARFKLDPLLFEKYPELYEPGDTIVATGLAVRPAHLTSIPTPRAVEQSTLRIYNNFADWCFNMISSNSIMHS
ncbi:hypothetical protein BDV27DRAFT_119611 [Aspergillus caelatus]|uniref:Uncharacterized protein n=1 Tax=Aspergillus caelatus TaxID=61420 RepID=A0A5N7AKR5_9EURO|nr:uncharacterized protein BDV27DRAFT_119611 [Aspergillus caelatus]KAE8370303.1 hypothetical protein BDV27DRAFT_119611 [Aspergillus caelatus]